MTWLARYWRRLAGKPPPQAEPLQAEQEMPWHEFANRVIIPIWVNAGSPGTLIINDERVPKPGEGEREEGGDDGRN